LRKQVVLASFEAAYRSPIVTITQEAQLLQR